MRGSDTKDSPHSCMSAECEADWWKIAKILSVKTHFEQLETHGCIISKHEFLRFFMTLFYLIKGDNKIISNKSLPCPISCLISCLLLYKMLPASFVVRSVDIDLIFGGTDNSCIKKDKWLDVTETRKPALHPPGLYVCMYAWLWKQVTCNDRCIQI